MEYTATLERADALLIEAQGLLEHIGLHAGCSDADLLRAASSLQNLAAQLSVTAGAMLTYLERRDAERADRTCHLLKAFVGIADEALPNVRALLAGAVRAAS